MRNSNGSGCFSIRNAESCAEGRGRDEPGFAETGGAGFGFFGSAGGENFCDEMRARFGGRRGHGFGHGKRGGFFDRFGGSFPGGPGMRAARMLAAGDLQLVILLMLSERPRHGYEIIKDLGEKSSGIYTPSPGVVYPALTFLEESGYAISTSVANKKLYTITPDGLEHLDSYRQTAEETLEQLERFGQKLANFQKQFTEDENDAEDFGRKAGSRSEWREMKMQFREMRDELKSALMEKISASSEEKKRVLEVLRRAIDEIRGK